MYTGELAKEMEASRQCQEHQEKQELSPSHCSIQGTQVNPPRHTQPCTFFYACTVQMLTASCVCIHMPITYQLLLILSVGMYNKCLLCIRYEFTMNFNWLSVETRADLLAFSGH